MQVGISLRILDLPTHIVAKRAVQLLSKIVVDVQGLVKRESGDPDGNDGGA
jgi:hypothetical protein